MKEASRLRAAVWTVRFFSCHYPRISNSSCNSVPSTAWTARSVLVMTAARAGSPVSEPLCHQPDHEETPSEFLSLLLSEDLGAEPSGQPGTKILLLEDPGNCHATAADSNETRDGQISVAEVLPAPTDRTSDAAEASRLQTAPRRWAMFWILLDKLFRSPNALKAISERPLYSAVKLLVRQTLQSAFWSPRATSACQSR